MKEILDKYKKGSKIKIGKNEAEITSELMKFKDYYAIYADITKNVDFNKPCGNYKIDEKIALIIRNKELLTEMGFTVEERKAIYCHELGHSFSLNQKNDARGSIRQIDKEIDSDTFAVEKCGMLPSVLESALAKTYEYEIKHLDSKKGLTQEKIDRFINEMRARKRNIEKLARNKEDLMDR